MSPRRRVALGAAVVAAMALAGVATAGAHSEYARSEPAAGARIPRSPARVSVWFTQELFRRAGANTLAVLAVDGSRVDDGEPVIDAADRTRLSVGLPQPLAAGAYRVEWQSLSALDGDAATGAFEFTIDPAAPEPAVAEGTAGAAAGESEPATLSGGETSVWWMAIALPAVLLSLWLGVRALRAPFEGRRA